MHDDRADSERMVTDSSGDVFADLGLDLTRDDQLKIAIAMEITKVITKAGYTQEEVAKIIGTDQSKVSALTRGKLKGFSQQRLFKYLIELGYNVDVSLSAPKEGEAGRIRVRIAA